MKIMLSQDTARKGVEQNPLTIRPRPLDVDGMFAINQLNHNHVSGSQVDHQKLLSPSRDSNEALAVRIRSQSFSPL